MIKISTLILAAALTFGTTAAFADDIAAGAATNGGGVSPGASAVTSGSVNAAGTTAGVNTNASVSSKKQMERAQTTGSGKVQGGTEKR
jgi:hypothetical protein